MQSTIMVFKTFKKNIIINCTTQNLTQVTSMYVLLLQ